MKRSSALLLSAAVLASAMLLSCTPQIPSEALKLSPEALATKQLQTRRFDGVSKGDLLSACNGVLQDLGFNLDESETELGVFVASKQRDATETAQVIASVAMVILTGTATPVDRDQVIRVSVVARQAGEENDRSYFVRVTFQRIVTSTQNQITKMEGIYDEEIYAEFFDRLSKSLFLEAQKI